MEDTAISLDLYPHIIKYCDYGTLNKMKNVNNFCYDVVKKEQKKRLKSIFPFDEENAKIRILTKDIILEKIVCIIDNNVIDIPPEKYSIPYVSEVLQSWFLYHFAYEKWILTGKILKSIIRLANKSESENVGEILTFQYKGRKSFLTEIN
jgi:hypothetical protein